MEFLDPKKQRAHLIRLFIGYILIGAALILTTVILLYQAYGFGLKNGEVIQNGLVFLSSQPTTADIYVNGQRRTEQTNTRILMETGQYTVELKRAGYDSWKRAISVEGGTVARFDYPLLFPSKLQTTPEKKYDIPPTMSTESPDRHWLLIQADPNYATFDIADISKPFKTPTFQAITLPASISTLTGAHSWKLVEWSNDNRHVLLQHTATDNGKTSNEYILLDRESPEQSVNLTTTLGLNLTQISLRDKKYDKYFVYTAEDHKLQIVSLDQPKQPQLLLDHVLAYKSYGPDVVLYATDKDATAGKSYIKLLNGQKTYNIRQVAAGDTYMIELTKYQGNWYVVTGSPSENRTYIYKNPMAAIDADATATLVPVQVLKVANPNYVAFSDSTRFVMVENGQQFAVYDVENQKGYSYTATQPLDQPQPHAYWMDGSHISYIGNGKTFVFDFDNTNQHLLGASSGIYRPMFDRDYKVLYNLTQQTGKSADGKDVIQFDLSGTALRTPADQ